MKVCFLGGVFDSSHNEEIISKTRTYVEYAANNFQKKIINGLKLINVDTDVISAPFLGAYPNAYNEWYFKGFNSKVVDKSGYTYVDFLNIWGLRNYSRELSAKKALKKFITYEDNEKLLIVYTPHTPFIKAANYAKQRDRRIKVCLVVPDLPQYMNLADKVSPMYRFFKKYDVRAFQSENKKVDSYVVLTEQMTGDLDVGNRPYCVVEGIYEPTTEKSSQKKGSDLKQIVYTGKLNRSFGIMDLVQAFENIKDPNIQLIICGSGEESENVKKHAQNDPRIKFKGQVTSEMARKFILEGDVLVNPRKNDSEYTKYSFPSKIIDYLATGNPVVAYRLDGIPKRYERFIHFAENNSCKALEKAIRNVLYGDIDVSNTMSKEALMYLRKDISMESVARRIMKMNGFIV